MAIQVDTYVTPKSRHRICEDYVLGRCDPLPHVILADGCSSSRGSHLGAMILAHAAGKELTGYYGNTIDGADFTFNNNLPDYFDMGDAVIHRARMTADQLGIDPQALDATLMTAFCHRNTVIVYVYGDGVAAAGPDVSGRYSIMDVSCPENAPFYLSYRLDAARRKAYSARFDQPKQVCAMENNRRTVQQKTFDEPVIFQFDLDITPVVLIASDGLSAFVRKGERLPYIPLADIVPAFTAFKNYNGQFLKRRARRAIKAFEKEDIHPTDDLSMGVIMGIMPEEPGENEVDGGRL